MFGLRRWFVLVGLRLGASTVKVRPNVGKVSPSKIQTHYALGVVNLKDT
jgi:hypothetical protein